MLNLTSLKGYPRACNQHYLIQQVLEFYITLRLGGLSSIIIAWLGPLQVLEQIKVSLNIEQSPILLPLFLN